MLGRAARAGDRDDSRRTALDLAGAAGHAPECAALRVRGGGGRGRDGGVAGRC